jgi:hypothetical protein
MVAQSVRDGVVDKLPWYEPSDVQPGKPINVNHVKDHFDTLTISPSEKPGKASASS